MSYGKASSKKSLYLRKAYNRSLYLMALHKMNLVTNDVIVIFIDAS